jgi:hypothetical protein
MGHVYDAAAQAARGELLDGAAVCQRLDPAYLKRGASFKEMDDVKLLRPRVQHDMGDNC